MIVRSLVLRTCVLKRLFAKYNTGTVPYGIVQCTVRYRTGTVSWYGTSKCIYPSRDADYCFCDIIFNFVTIVSYVSCYEVLGARAVVIIAIALTKFKITSLPRRPYFSILRSDQIWQSYGSLTVQNEKRSLLTFGEAKRALLAFY